MSRAPADSGFFATLLDMAEGKWQVLLLQAYFDESERQNGLLCVAGYAFASQQARKFIKEWRKLFDPFGGFHMREFAHGVKRFADTTPCERDALMRSAVSLIKCRMTAGIAVSCMIPEMKALSPKWIRGFGNAYPICCHWATNALCMVLKKLGNTDKIIYTFEAGHAHEAEARDFVRTMGSTIELKNYYHHAGDAFLPKADAVPLQAADLLAWEWAKFRDETLDKKKRPMRGSLRSLVESSPRNYFVAHMHGQRLAKAMVDYGNLGLEQLAEKAIRDRRQ